MDFREATDGLFANVDHEELAKALGVSIASIRQARLRPEAQAHRPPPSNWIDGVRKLATDRVEHYRKLLERLDEIGVPTGCSDGAGAAKREQRRLRSVDL